MNKVLGVCLLCAVCTARAETTPELYLDLGIGGGWGNYANSNDTSAAKPYTGIHGLAEAGLKMDNVQVFVLHASDLTTTKDQGFTFIGVKTQFKTRF